MPSNDRYKIPKAVRQITLWVHPEGRVVGSLFLSLHTRHSPGTEDPATVINEVAPFLILQRMDTGGPCFYNKKAIIRVEYQEDNPLSDEGMTTLHCHMLLLDGSHIEGTVRCILPPGHARLSDYLNLMHEPFAKLYLQDGCVCMVNKAYVVRVSPVTAQATSAPCDLSDAVEIDEMSV